MSHRRESSVILRLVAEFGVIVVGVLVALAVDRWVAGIDQQQREEEYLIALRADFETNRTAAQHRLQAEEQLEELATALLLAFESRTAGEDPERLVLAAEFSGYVVYESYAAGAWDNLSLIGGSLSTADPTLQIAISDFFRGVEWAERLDSEFLQHILSYRGVARASVPPSLRVEILRQFPGWHGEDIVAAPLAYLRGVDLSQAVDGVLNTRAYPSRSPMS